MQAQQARSSAGLSLLQALNIALGIWILGSTYWLGLHVYKGARVANGLGATLIIGFAITQLAVPRWRVWSWVGVLTGVFVAAAPFLFDFTVEDGLVQAITFRAEPQVLASLVRRTGAEQK